MFEFFSVARNDGLQCEPNTRFVESQKQNKYIE